MVSIRGSCLKLLRVTCSSCLLHFFLSLFGWDSCLELTLVSFSITISTFFYHACMFNSWRICAQVALIVGSTTDGENSQRSRCARRGIFCLSRLAWEWETYWGVEWMDLLRSNVDVWSTRKESSTSYMVHGGLCWKIFYFLTRDFGVLDSLGKNILLPYCGYFGEESFAFLLEICF